MSLLIVLGLLLPAITTYAQYFDEDVQRVFDSIYNSSDFQHQSRNDTTAKMAEERYDRLYDSVEYAVVNTYILKRLADGGKFSWPRRIKENPPSKTYWYLLSHKYNMDNAVSSGCVDQHSFLCFDRIMGREIRKRYGSDFFEQSEAEAAGLDEKGLGLKLPYIRGAQAGTIALIRKAVPLLDTLHVTDFNMSSHVRYLLICFKNNKVQNAFIGVNAWGIQASLESMRYSEYLKATLSKLDWIPPTFNRLPAECTVVVDFVEETMEFH